MTDKLKIYATVALICAWPLINFAIYNAALLSGSEEGIRVILITFATAVFFSSAAILVMVKIFGTKNAIRFTLVICVVIILFFSFPQIMRAWDYIFITLNLSIAPHYGYGGTFLALPALVMIFINHRIFLQITMVFSLCPPSSRA